MKKLLNMPIKFIDSNNLEFVLEYKDLVPEGFFEMYKLLMEGYVRKDHTLRGYYKKITHTSQNNSLITYNSVTKNIYTSKTIDRMLFGGFNSYDWNMKGSKEEFNFL